MAEATEIPSFRPSGDWYEDWPYDVDTSVQIEACVTGAAADRAVEAFLLPLLQDPGGDRAGGVRVHYRGGFTVESAPAADGDGWRIVLASAGEDGFDSLRSAADDLVDALRATPGEVRLAWHELPATRVTDTDPREEVTMRVVRSGLVIRDSLGPGEYPRLVQVWRSAVDATHQFLAEEHRDEIESRLATDYLPQVDLHVADVGGLPVGFAGVSGESLEMLFVDARQRGREIGTALLSFVVAECGVTTVDVNEQNAQALEFYRRRGFTVVGRSELDDQGRPYPILHMALQSIEVA